MGADGGTIPTRGELVKVKKKKVLLDKDYDLESKWLRCALSAQHLREPIVACPLGRLFNKEAVIGFLLDRGSYADQAGAYSYIRSLKDLKVLNLTKSKKAKGTSTVTGSDLGDVYGSDFKCPVTDALMNGKSRFVYIKACGCVLSLRSLKEIPTTKCHLCQQDFESKDVIEINPPADVREEQLVRLAEARRIEMEKKDKRKKRKGDGDNNKATKKAKQSAKSAKEKIEDDSELLANSETYKSLFLDPEKQKEQEKNGTFTCRAVHRGHLGF